MLILQVVITAILILPIPAVVGIPFAGLHNGRGRLLFSWVSGQIALWAGFLFLSIPLILRESSFSLLMTVFGVYTAVLIIVSLAVTMMNRKKQKATNQPVSVKTGKSPKQIFLWAVFGLLIVTQIVLTVIMAYEEGDDAFYVAISTVTESSDTMYRILPYTGMTTGLDARHGLAPFPIWVAWLAGMSGMPAVTMAQVVLPIGIILFTYGIYYLIAVRLFAQREQGVAFFMTLTALLILFGGYSVYSAENFLLVRASQGKAVIANVIIPFLLLLFMILLDNMEKNVPSGVRFWLLLALTMAAGCLCSTQGTILTGIFSGVTALCAAISYRRWKILIPMMMCCIVPGAIALMYLMIR